MKNIKYKEMPMYCPHCGRLNIGYEDEDGKIRYECKNPKCRVVMIRTVKSRRHDSMELYQKSS